MSSPALCQSLQTSGVLKSVNEEAVGVGAKDLGQEVGQHNGNIIPYTFRNVKVIYVKSNIRGKKYFDNWQIPTT